MISIEEVRQEVTAAFKAIHDANYPTILVNYPNFVVVDIERQEDPFVSLELDLSQLERSAIGERELLIPGVLHVNHYFREGTGTSSTTLYTTMLNEYLGMTQVGALQFQVARPISIQTFPGWLGTMNSIGFDVVPSLSC